MAMTVMPAGAVSTPNSAIWWRTAQVREASMIASYTSVMALRLSESLITPLIQDRPMRSISWRRMARMELAKSLMLPALRSSERRAGLHVQGLARAGLQIVVVAKPADRFDRLVERVAQES